MPIFKDLESQDLEWAEYLISDSPERSMLQGQIVCTFLNRLVLPPTLEESLPISKQWRKKGGNFVASCIKLSCIIITDQISSKVPRGETENFFFKHNISVERPIFKIVVVFDFRGMNSLYHTSNSFMKQKNDL